MTKRKKYVYNMMTKRKKLHIVIERDNLFMFHLKINLSFFADLTKNGDEIICLIYSNSQRGPFLIAQR
jgi:hypothetical protein